MDQEGEPRRSDPVVALVASEVYTKGLEPLHLRLSRQFARSGGHIRFPLAEMTRHALSKLSLLFYVVLRFLFPGCFKGKPTIPKPRWASPPPEVALGTVHKPPLAAPPLPRCRRGGYPHTPWDIQHGVQGFL